MKQKWLIFLAMLFVCNVCFAKISVLTFEIYEVKDYDELDDNFLVFNKTETNIARVFLYGVKEADCPRGFKLDDFVIEKDDNRALFNDKAELVCMIKDVKKGKHVKKYLTEQLLHKYRYFILVVDGMLPEGYDYQINKMFARYDDFYLHITDNYGRHNSSSETTYYTTESSSSRAAEIISDTAKALEQGFKDFKENMKNQPCGSCRGNGNCSSCGGTGKRSGNACFSCHGSGVCTKCNGTGKAYAM